MENPPPLHTTSDVSPIPFASPVFATGPVGYSSFQPIRRPGVLTAVGIVSIVLGGLGSISNCGAVGQAIIFKTIMKNGAPVRWMTTTTTTTSGVATYSSVTVFGPSTTGPTTVPAGTTLTTAPSLPTMRSSTSTVMLIEGAISLVLAISLMVLGILVLSNQRAGWRGHRVYAWIKLSVVLLTMITTWLTYSDMFAEMDGMGGSVAPGMVPLLMGAGAGVLGCVYPIALLSVMRTRTVKTFYANLPAGNPA